MNRLANLGLEDVGLTTLPLPTQSRCLKLQSATFATNVELEWHGMAALLAHLDLTECEWLNLEHTGLTTDTVRLLANHSALEGVLALDVSNNRIGSLGIHHLIKSRALRSLNWLRARRCRSSLRQLDALRTIATARGIELVY